MNQQHNLFKINNTTIPHFDYEEFGVCGVGRNRLPLVSMDKYVDTSNFKELHHECCVGLSILDDIKMGMIYGAIPPEESKRLQGAESWSSILQHIEKYDVDGYHLKSIDKILKLTDPSKHVQSIYKYVYFAMGGAIPWFFALYLKRNDFRSKTQDLGQWTPAIKYFPTLMKYLETLPFKTIGRVLFFTTYPNAGVIIHRDSIVTEHKDHNINLFFDGGWRPSFVWDDIKKTKTYLEKDSKSYFFNNRDYHGVDPESTFRYTLRIDGTFTDKLCEELGLEDGFTWKWKYKST